MAEVKQVNAERSSLQKQVAAAQSQIHDLQDMRERLEGEKVELQDTVQRAESATCRTLQQKVADANNKKAQMHRALDDAVKLGRRLAKENKALRQAMAKTKQQLAAMMHRDSEASAGLHKQIEKLHRELQA